MLIVFLDSKSINSVYNEMHNLIEDSLIRDPSVFMIRRQTCDVSQEKINLAFSCSTSGQSQPVAILILFPPI